MKTQAPRILSVVLASLLALPALAEEGHRWSLTPHVGYRMGGDFEVDGSGDRLKLDDNSSYGLTLSIPWESNTELEIWYSRQTTDVDVSPVTSSDNKLELDFDFLQLGGTYFFEPRGIALPYVVFTLGGTRVSSSEPGVDSDTFFSGSLGGGWQFFPAERLGLRLEGRILGTLVDSSSSIFCGSGPSGSGCLVQVSGDVLWQYEVSAGAIFRF